jgi:hypothetical protein
MSAANGSRAQWPAPALYLFVETNEYAVVFLHEALFEMSEQDPLPQ